MQTIEKKMREAVKGLFKEKKVDFVIGFQNGSLPKTARPFFVRSLHDAENLVWNEHCIGKSGDLSAEAFRKAAAPERRL